jgi:hypothetical protein
MPVIPAMIGKHKWENHSPSQPGQKARPYFQNNQSKKGWRNGSSGRALSHRCEALSSNSSTVKKKKNPKTEVISWCSELLVSIKSAVIINKKAGPIADVEKLIFRCLEDQM